MRSYPDGQILRKASFDGGIEPVWARTGELFYRKRRRFMSVFVRREAPEVSTPRVAFDTDFIDTPGVSYDVSGDGKRLLVLKRINDDTSAVLNVRVNWASALR